MGVKKLKPTSPGRRFQTVSDFDTSHAKKPEKTLLDKKKRSSGRNAYGRITSRHRGGGHKRRYRIVDFRRNKDGVPAKVAAIEYDPNRNARIALLHYARRREALHPGAASASRSATSSSRARGQRFGPATPCRCATSRPVPLSTPSRCAPVVEPRWARVGRYVDPADVQRGQHGPAAAPFRARCARSRSIAGPPSARSATPRPNWSRSARRAAAAGRASARRPVVLP